MTPDQFWQQVRESELLNAAEIEKLTQELSHSADATANATTLAEWLVRQRLLTVYQARALLAGRTQFRFAGAFQIQEPRGVSQDWGRRWDAIHRGTGHPLILHLAGVESAASHLRDHSAATFGEHLDVYYGTVVHGAQTAGLSELPSGSTVRNLLRKQKQLRFDEVCEIGVQACVALIEMHARGEIHGHVAPEEIMVDTNRHVTLLRHHGWVGEEIAEGGLAKIALERAPYCAPELAAVDSTQDALTDVYALGCVFYEMLTGRTPFPATSVEEILRKHAQESIVAVHQLADAPEAFHQMISFMMAKRRSVRHTSLIDVQNQLARFLPPGWSPPKKAVRETERGFRASWSKPSLGGSRRIESGEAGGAPPMTERSSPEMSSEQTEPKQKDVSRPPGASDPADLLRGIAVTRERTDYASVKRRFRGNGGRWSWEILGLVSFCLAAGVFYLLWRVGEQDQQSAASPKHNTTSSSTAPVEVTRERASTDPAADLIPTVALVDDDGQTPWQSPTSGVPIVISHQPAGAQFFMFLRPASLLASTEGQRLWKVLDADRQMSRWFANWPVAIADLESILVSWTPRDNGSASALVQFRLQAEQVAKLRNVWTQLPSDSHGEHGVLGDWHVRLLADDPTLVLLGTRETVEEATQADESILQRSIATLSTTTDAERAVTVWGSPRFLDDEMRWRAPWNAWREPVLLFLGEKAEAAAWSLALDSQRAYLECRVVYSADESLAARARWMPRQMDELANRIERTLGQTPIDPHWQPLAIRFPRMLQYVAQQTRCSAEQGSLLTNVVLPPEAVHNLVLASECLLSQRAGGANQLEFATNTDEQILASGGWEEILATPMTLVIPQQSLEAVVQELAALAREETKNSAFQIEVRGEDLQKDGITRNQQIRNLRLQDRPLRDILTELVRRANPMAVTSVQQSEQKLVWAIAPDQGEDGRRVWITTRTTALQKGLQLPKEFLEVVEPPTLK